MLAADKLQLQSALKQQATALKEKEFNLHHSNLSTYSVVASKLCPMSAHTIGDNSVVLTQATYSHEIPNFD